jgi:Ca2+-binding EF-hand superfamily protein
MDGLLSGDEISERMQSRVEQMDENEDGAICKEEFLAAMQRFRASRQGGGGLVP